MPVTVGNGVGEYNSTVQHVSNGDPANQTVFRAPSINLENRTDALKTFTEAQETLRNLQIGSSSSAIGGVQGSYNTNHKHTGADGSGLIDFQQVYNNDSDQADFQLAAGGYFEIKKNDTTTLFKVDNNTGVVTIGGSGLAADSIKDSHIDWGTGAGQVSADDMPDGSTNIMLTSVYKTSVDNHISANASSAHALKLQGRPLQMNNISASGTSDDVSTECSGETAGGSTSQEGLVTSAPSNWVIVKEADTNDDLLDGSGNKVYGRLTESSGTWTLSYYSNVAGSETAYDFTSPTNISWWVQKVYNLSNIPVFDPIFSVPSDQVAAEVNVETLIPSILPAGMITPYAGAAAPSGWFVCDGASKSTTTYSALFAVIGYTYGGSGASFNVPDYRGMFLRGAGTHGTQAKAAGGNFAGGSVGDFNADQMQGHKHNEVGDLVAGAAGSYMYVLGSGGATGYPTTTPITDGVNGAPRTGNETKPASYSVNYIIKY